MFGIWPPGTLWEITRRGPDVVVVLVFVLAYKGETDLVLEFLVLVELRRLVAAVVPDGFFLETARFFVAGLAELVLVFSSFFLLMNGQLMLVVDFA